jgi:metallo-beta-lactamase class B
MICRGAILGVVAIGGIGASSLSRAQALWDSGKIPQPHLARALAYAAKENSWRHPGVSPCYWDDGQPGSNIVRDLPGTRIFDSLYYVGNGKFTVYALDTSEGIILIDSMNNQDEVDQFIIPNLKSVGLDPARLKVLIVSHAHGDHYGGSRYLQDQYRMRVYMSAADWDQVEHVKGRPDQGAPARRDLTIADGGTITLGDASIKVYVSPGHTPGSLSMLIPVKDHGQPRLLAYFGGVNSKGLSPQMHTAFDQSYDRLIGIVKQVKADGYLAAHPLYDDSIFKNEWLHANPNYPNAYLVGTPNVISFLQEVKECNLNSADLERAMPVRRSSGNVPVR